jgi:hypothetical protein
MYWRRALSGSVLASCLWLAACGGGVYIGIGDDGWDDPPSVSVAASVQAAAAGSTVRLVAAATDDDAVDEVVFFRLEDDGSATQLGRLRSTPYQWDTVLPASATGRARYFARAIDSVGQASDSTVVDVQLL